MVEGKVLSTEANLPQAIGTCVVASFTAKARHPEQKALVPTVLIDDGSWLVLIVYTLNYHMVWRHCL